MNNEDAWDLVRNARGWRLADAGSGAIRAAMLFGSAGIALALILVPVLDGATRDQYAATQPFPGDIDMTSTGSVQPSGTYTIRKSVLQSSPDSVCYIRANGARVGDC